MPKNGEAKECVADAEREMERYRELKCNK